MPPRNATLALVGAVGLVAGAGLGVWFAGGRSADRTQAAPAPHAPASSELAPVLGELARTLDALRATLERQRAPAAMPAADAPLREPLANDALPRDPLHRDPLNRADDPELVAAVQALAASLRNLDLGSAPATVANHTPALRLPAWVDREAAFAGFGMRAAVQADDELAWERAHDAFRKKHLFWTMQQVLDAYGKPDEIEVGEMQTHWSYRLPVTDGDEEFYYFHFNEGLVYSVEYSD